MKRNLLRMFTGRLARFFGWWFGFSGLYTMMGTCPCCGQQGCVAGAGVIGLLCAIGTLLKHPINGFKRLLSRRRG